MSFLWNRRRGGLDNNGARTTVAPLSDLVNDDRDVVFTNFYSRTNAKLKASADDQELTISQPIDSDIRVAPTCITMVLTWWNRDAAC
jgi:hypothetical protein